MAGSYEVLEWDDKDPAEIINEGVDFATALDAGDSLNSIAFSFIDQAGLTKTNEVISGAVAKVTLSGGTIGLVGKLLCVANTLGGEELKQVVKIKIKAKV